MNYKEIVSTSFSVVNKLNSNFLLAINCFSYFFHCGWISFRPLKKPITEVHNISFNPKLNNEKQGYMGKAYGLIWIEQLFINVLRLNSRILLNNVTNLVSTFSIHCIKLINLKINQLTKILIINQMIKLNLQFLPNISSRLYSVNSKKLSDANIWKIKSQLLSINFVNLI